MLDDERLKERCEAAKAFVACQWATFKWTLPEGHDFVKIVGGLGGVLI